jgi:nitrogen-specific signal transduction histidine kinase
LLTKGARAEIDQFIKEFRDFNSAVVASVDVQLSYEKNETLEAFLGESSFSLMETDLDTIGVETVEDLKELETDDINMLAANLKKVQVKKFIRKMAEFVDLD